MTQRAVTGATLGAWVRRGGRTAFDLLRATFAEWSEDKAPRLGASMAYYTVFALAPTLVIVLAIGGRVFGAELAGALIDAQVRGLIGPNGADFIQTLIEQTGRQREGLLASLLGAATLLLAALGAFDQLQGALNTIWEVQPRPGGLRGIARERLAAFGLFLAVGALLLAASVASAVVTVVANTLSTYLFPQLPLVELLNFALYFLLGMALFALIFKVLPDAKIAWADVWLGAALTSLLFNLGRYAISLYLATAGVGSTYGAAGSLVVILLWVYYSAQILFLGAEFTQVYANRYGSKIRPAPYARRVSAAERERQGLPHQPEVEPALRTTTPARIAPVSAALGEFFTPEPPARHRPAYVGAVILFLLGVSTGLAVALSAVRLWWPGRASQ